MKCHTVSRHPRTSCTCELQLHTFTEVRLWTPDSCCPWRHSLHSLEVTWPLTLVDVNKIRTFPGIYCQTSAFMVGGVWFINCRSTHVSESFQYCRTVVMHKVLVPLSTVALITSVCPALCGLKGAQQPILENSQYSVNIHITHNNNFSKPLYSEHYTVCRIHLELWPLTFLCVLLICCVFCWTHHFGDECLKLNSHSSSESLEKRIKAAAGADSAP